MKNTKTFVGLKNPNTLSTDIYLRHLSNEMTYWHNDIIGKVLTFIEAISENDQVSKARKDIVAQILHNGLTSLQRTSELEMEWLNRSLYDEETLKNNLRGAEYVFSLAVEDSKDYEESFVVKPNKK